MKSIPLKILYDPRFPDDKAQAIDYDTALREVIRQPLDRTKGIDVTEMRKSIRVMEALDRANGTLELEDSDYELLKQKTEAMPWGMADRRILELIDDVLGAS